MIYEEDTTQATAKVPPPPHRCDCPACGCMATVVLRPSQPGRLAGTCARCGAGWVLVAARKVSA